MERFRSTMNLKSRYNRWKESLIKNLINYCKIFGLEFSLSTHLEVKWTVKSDHTSIFGLYNAQISQSRRPKVPWVAQLRKTSHLFPEQGTVECAPLHNCPKNNCAAQVSFVTPQGKPAGSTKHRWMHTQTLVCSWSGNSQERVCYPLV